MIRRAISFVMVAAGLLMLVGGLGALMPLATASAQAVPQPTPRPALPPEEGGQRSAQSISDMGHITGTVIDQRTGAPMPMAAVRVGDQIISADANGNYDLWTLPGTYTVGVIAQDGTLAQAVSVEIPTDKITVQHLSGVSAAPVAAPVESVAPAAPAAAVVVAPAAPEVIVAVDNQAVEPMIPARLPRTAGNPLLLFEPWFWVSLGMALLLGGLLIAARADSLRAPARALANYASGSPSMAADAAALLAALLTSEVRAASLSEDALLQALLNTNTQQRRVAQEILADLLRQPVRA